jgi:hypothetical protein
MTMEIEFETEVVHSLRQYNLPRKRSFFQLLFLIFQWEAD